MNMASKNKRSPITRAPIRKPQPPAAVSVSDALAFAELGLPGSAARSHGEPTSHFTAPTVMPPPHRVAEAVKETPILASAPAVPPTAAPAPTLEEEAARIARIGRTPDGDIRLSVNIARALHIRLKVLSARTGITAGELLERWISENTPEE